MLTWSFNKLLALIRQSIILSFLFLLSICLSVFIYSLFYNWYIPKLRIKRNVDFELFSTIPNKNQESFKTNELFAIVNLFDKTGETLHYGQEYSINLIFDLPESDNNFNLGMFGVTIDVIDIDGRRSSTFRTMGTLVYKSFLLRSLSTLFYFPYYIFGRFDQRQTLDLSLKENFIDNSYMPAHKIVIKIHDKLQFYSALLIIEAKFYGLKYFLHNWFFITSTLICTGLTFIIYIIFITTVYDLKSLLFASKGNDCPKSNLNNFDMSESNRMLTGEIDDILLKNDLKRIMEKKQREREKIIDFKRNLNSFKSYLKANKHSID